ncbi:MAG: barstar family protein [Oscillospiraceae bacterium]|nr:barstar family protein [Oscillospiraceae bacterium]
MNEKQYTKYTVDFRNVKHFLEVHFVIREGLDFPDYYGWNRDAFWDCITEPFGESVLWGLKCWNNSMMMRICCYQLSKNGKNMSCNWEEKTESRSSEEIGALKSMIIRSRRYVRRMNELENS